MKFIYTRIKDEIRIDKIEDPEAVIYVPEQFEDWSGDGAGFLCAGSQRGGGDSPSTLCEKDRRIWFL